VVGSLRRTSSPTFLLRSSAAFATAGARVAGLPITICLSIDLTQSRLESSTIRRSANPIPGGSAALVQ
jgi:hypothetical protein